MLQKIVVSEEGRQRGRLYSVIATLVSMIIVAAIGYGIWFLLGKLASWIGVLYLLFIAFLEIKNIWTGWQYKPATSTSIDDIVRNGAETAKANANSSGPNGNIGVETYAKYMGAVVVLTAMGLLLHYLIACILFFSFGKDAHFPISYLAFGLIIWNVLLLMRASKNIYQAFRDTTRKYEDGGRVRFWFRNILSKLRSAATLIFFLALMADSMGILGG